MSAFLAERSGMNAKRKRERREHELDRMISAATYRAQRAREGRGYSFEIPARARR